MFPRLFIKFSIFKIQFSVSFCYRADYLAGVSCGNGPVGDIFGDYTAGSDYGIVSDVYARTNDRISADPYIIAQNDLNAVLIHGVAGIGVYRMSSGIDSYIGGKLAVISDFYFCHVQNGAVIVGEEVFSYLNVISIIAVEGRIDKSSFRFSQQFLYDRGDFIKIRAIYCI